MSFLGYIAGSLIAPNFAGYLISKGLTNREENKLIQEIDEKVSEFNRKFDDTEVDSNYFVEFLEQSNVGNSIIDRVFHVYKTSKDDYNSLSKDLAKEAIDFVNLKKDKFKHQHVKRASDFEDYFSELFEVLVDFRESLLSIKDKAMVSIIDESVNRVERNVNRNIEELKAFRLNIITCEELNNWYKTNTKNQCTLELFNHENKEFINELLNRLSKNTINIKGENVFETVAYITYLFLNNDRFKEYKDKLIIVEDEESWNKLGKMNYSNYIFVNRFNNIDHLEVIEKNKCVFVYGKNDYSKSKDLIELDKRFFRNLIDKVTQCGFDHQEAYDISRASRNNYTILMRRLLLGKQKEPIWANLKKYKNLVPAMIINQWLDTDAVFFELLIDDKQSYNDYINELEGINNVQDPFFVVHKTWYNNNKYMISDPEDVWDFFKDLVDNSLFDKLEPMIDLILGEIDPKFELPTTQHYYASILGYVPQFSNELKNGFIETLIYLSRPESKISHNIKQKIEDALDRINSKKEWFSISEILPLIFEINPDAVLNKIEKELDKDDSGLVNLFIEKSDDFFTGRNYYTHVICTLEKALYSKGYAYRAIVILSKLMDFDIEYKISNSPLNTLYNALVAWNHEYIYSIDEKIEFVKYIVENREKGWQLLKKLLPSNRGGSISTLSRPKYMPYLLSDELKWKKQIYDTYNEYYQIALNSINGNVDNLCVFFEDSIFFNFEIYVILKVTTLELINKFIDEEKYVLYKRIYSLISRNRHFQNAEWVQSEENMKKLENEILDKIKFQDESYRYQHIFESYHDILLNPVVYERNDGHNSITENQKLEDELKRSSIKKLVELNINWSKFFRRLSKDTSNSIGIYMAEVKNDIVFIEEISKSLADDNRLSILAAYYGSLYSIFGLDIVDSFINSKKLSEKKYLELMLSRVKLDKSTLFFLDKLSEEHKEIFWKNNGGAYHVPEEFKDYALNNYISYRNANTLIELADHYSYPTDKLIEVLEVVKESQIMHHQMTSYHIERIFEKIYEENFPKEEISQQVMNLEIYFLPILGKENGLKYLRHNLSINPNLSAELIKYAYKSENSNDNKVLDENGKRLAEIAHSILFSIKFSPTNDGIGLIDYSTLKDWCNKYTLAITQNNQRKVGLQYLGQFLANTNMVNESKFPQESVKQVIEEAFDDELLIGFSIEISNSIGVRTISDGSDFLELSRRYEGYVQNSKMYPKTQKILNAISESFHRQYESEKESAKYEY
ncbi:hypothetical protein [Clostridium sp.]|uniref:hypothetical protein n=1 Tax=Clostridium sp. TaxID=1506 RepID=UPI003216204F